MNNGYISHEEYMNPEYRDIPLVKLPNKLNPYNKKGIEIYAYLLYMNPLLNVKAIPSYYLVKEAIKQQPKSLIESSSGNTAFSMSIYSKILGNINTTALVSSEVLPGKLGALKISCANIEYYDEPICPDPNDLKSSINLAKIRAHEKTDVINPGQYDNDINRQSHYNISGKHLYKKLSYITDLVCSLGTTGTMIGISKYLKKHINISTIGVVRKENNPIPGPRTLGLLRHIGFERKKYVDFMYAVSTFDAYNYSKKLCQFGILGGPSSGMQYKVALDQAKRYYTKGENNKSIVFICCDSMLPYSKEYESIVSKNTTYSIFDRIIKSPKDIDKLNKYYKNISIIDLRHYKEFNEYHIHGSRNICFNYIDEYFELDHAKDDGYLFICALGAKSQIISEYMQSLGYNAFSLTGGIIERYNNGYKVCKNKECNFNYNKLGNII